jgi:hypothetical protein
MSAIFLTLTLFKPNLLQNLNILWFKLGIALGKIVSPIVLGIIFYSVITPTAIIGRLSGRDPLRLKKKSQTSYWIERNPHGPDSDSFKNQY